MGRLRLRILYSTSDRVNPALDSEQLSISEQLSSHLNNAIPLLSGSLAGSLLPPFPCDLAKGDNLGIFASTCILSISSSSLKVTWVSLCSLDQQCQTVKCQWAPFSFLEGTRQQRSWIALFVYTVNWHPSEWPSLTTQLKAEACSHPSYSHYQVPLYFLHRTYHQLIWSLY